MSNNKVLIPKTQILELRENNKRSQSRNTNGGDYNVTLDDPLIVEEGDQVAIHSVFLDTRTSNDGLIILRPDTEGGTTTTISAEFGYYMSNTPSSNETPFNLGAQIVSKNYTQNNGGVVQSANVNVDGEPYVACTRHIPADPSVLRNLQGLSISVDKDANGNPQYKTEINKNTKCKVSLEYAYKPAGDNNVVTDTLKIDMGVLRDLNAVGTIFNNGLVNVDSNIILDLNTRSGGKCITGAGFPVEFDSSQNITDPRTGQPSGVAVLLTNYIVSTPDNGQPTEYAQDRVSIIQDTTDRSDGSLKVFKDSVSIQVDSGTYTASQICDIIGQGFTNINMNGDIGSENYDLTANPLLTTSANLIRKARELKGAGVEDTIEFVRASDGGASFRLETQLENAPNNALVAGKPNYMVGTSQFGLLYNDTANKVELHLLHESLYDLSLNSTGQTQIRGYKNEAVTPARTGGQALTPAPKKFFVNKHSGIFFTKLEPRELWFGQLQFDESLETGITYVNKALVDNGQNINAPVFSANNTIPNALVDGRNITGDGKGLDAILQHKFEGGLAGGAGFTKAYDIADSFVAFPNYLATNTDDQIGIHSKGIINTGQFVGQEAEGYYQVELNLGIDQDIHGKDNTNNKIHGIVSRYYSQGSYTSSYGEGGIPYIHKGTPITINDINVRILNPDNSLAGDIDSNNTIFLQIQKNNN